MLGKVFQFLLFFRKSSSVFSSTTNRSAPYAPSGQQQSLEEIKFKPLQTHSFKFSWGHIQNPGNLHGDTQDERLVLSTDQVWIELLALILTPCHVFTPSQWPLFGQGNSILLDLSLDHVTCSDRPLEGTELPASQMQAQVSWGLCFCPSPIKNFLWAAAAPSEWTTEGTHVDQSCPC